MNKKILQLLLFLILFSSIKTLADEGYVSPESYAVNEADLIDYIDVPAPTKPNIDNLDKPVKLKLTKERKVRKNQKPYEERLIYKMAKWWTDERYKREETHHGTKHEIKVKQRMEYEKQQLEKKEQETQIQEESVPN